MRMPDAGALDLIAGLLSGQEWDTEMLNDIAEWIRCTGRPVKEIEEDVEEAQE